jgi:hypothetical protein
MGTLDNLAKLEDEVRRARKRLESLAERAVQLQNRLRADAPFIVTLDKLANEGKRPAVTSRPVERYEGDDGKLLSAADDPWDIRLLEK